MEAEKNTHDSYELIAEWLEEYNSTSDKYKKARLKALIVTRMIPVVKKIARTIARRAYDPLDDLVQAGSIGVLKAIDSYSRDVNEIFKVYAGHLIIGEMKHYLRDKLSAIRVPAYLQHLAHRITSFCKTLTLDELNDLTNDDVAEALNTSTSQVNFAMQIDRRRKLISLDNLYLDEDESLHYDEVLANNKDIEYKNIEDTKILLKDLIEKLPDEYKYLVKLFYYDDLNQNEIAQKLEMSKMKVSRKLKKAFCMLYDMINSDSTEERNDV